MNRALPIEMERYLQENEETLVQKLLELARIPAPSGQEDRRAEWVKRFLEEAGAKGVFVDGAKNVLWPIGCEGADEIVVLMAHTDVVFPDLDPLPITVCGERAVGPGVGDDTANLVAMLQIARYAAQRGLRPKTGVVFAANSCEEGLGNLKGCRAIMERYAGRVREVVSFDGHFGMLCNNAVGSTRRRVTVRTEGGHSFSAFGNRNAIYYLSSMITTLYAMKAPPFGKTTFNVGTISGGTSVNSIAQEASMLYEYRSDDRRGLEALDRLFESAADTYRAMEIEVESEILGVRPCAGAVDGARLSELTERAKRYCEAFTGVPHMAGSASTDCNIPLSLGIPAVCFALVDGAGSHTREEWISLPSLKKGARLAAAFILQYFH